MHDENSNSQQATSEWHYPSESPPPKDYNTKILAVIRNNPYIIYWTSLDNVWQINGCDDYWSFTEADGVIEKWAYIQI